MKIKAKPPWHWQVPKRQEEAMESSKCTDLTVGLGTCLYKHETQIYR